MVTSKGGADHPSEFEARTDFTFSGEEFFRHGFCIINYARNNQGGPLYREKCNAFTQQRKYISAAECTSQVDLSYGKVDYERLTISRRFRRSVQNSRNKQAVSNLGNFLRSNKHPMWEKRDGVRKNRLLFILKPIFKSPLLFSWTVVSDRPLRLRSFCRA